MKDKYWAKNKYSKVNPVDYENIRFSTNAGKLIDEAEKKTVLDLLMRYQRKQNKKSIILDTACGPGRLAFFLEKNLPTASITGVDINKNMLDSARIKALAQKSSVKFVQADFYHLPFTVNQFDVVAGLRYSMHLPDIISVLTEFQRVLKPNGILIFDIFNNRSVLKLKTPPGSKSGQTGLYSCQDIIRKAKDCKLEFLGEKGILLLGETIIRRFPDNLLFLLYPLIKPPFFLQDFSTKIVLCFKKT